MIKFEDYLNKEVRVITKMIFRNGREVNIKYFGTVIKCIEKGILILEKDGNKEFINSKHIKRIEQIISEREIEK